jgi:tRNA-2-methylthio-N6-dimethylallyladenosine synthase
LVIGVLGCMAQKDRDRIFKRAPHVDLVVGPGQLGQVPALLEGVFAGSGPRMEISLDRAEGDRQAIKSSFVQFTPDRPARSRATPHQAMVRVMFGCDKFCTYCIVPMTRGPEQGRAPSQILSEAKLLADQGAIEITLLGQTVNSYKFVEDGKTWRLADLLEALHEVEGIRRLKFVTNYPKDMTPRLLQAMRDLPKVSSYLHVPAQSGSDVVLERMKRGYTVGDYREMMARIRETLPSAAVSSDFIVGFTGETDADFQQTVDLVRECRFKNSFIFKYSVRPGTKGAELLPDDVPFDVKQRRKTTSCSSANASRCWSKVRVRMRSN